MTDSLGGCMTQIDIKSSGKGTKTVKSVSSLMNLLAVVVRKFQNFEILPECSRTCLGVYGIGKDREACGR
jgi:hypothetical protein